MVSIKDGDIDLDVLEVEDIIDVDVLQKFLDNFALGMNCAAVSVNRKGEEITKPSYYRPFCDNYVHKSSIGDARCAKCHNQMGEEAVKLGKPYVGECHAGLIDFAAPIIVKGVHLGTVLGGQVLDREPNETAIRNTADEIHVSDDALWDAAKQIDVIEKVRINAAAEVLYIVVNSLAQDGFKNLEIETVSKDLADNFLQISQTVDVLAESAQEITYSQQTLTKKITQVHEVTQEVSTVLGAIARIADKTKLIGLNASIEAARLGAMGSGFMVVAKEIQTLSEQSKTTVKQISDLNKEINDTMMSTIKDADSTLQVTEDQSAAMEELSATAQSTAQFAEQLEDLIK